MMSWSWTRWATGKRRCSSSCPTRMTPLISSFPCVIPSFSICCAKRRTMCMAAGCRFMCAASLTSAPISARSPSWKSWWPPSEAVRFSACLVLQAQSQLKAIYKDNAIPSSATWILPSSWAVRSRTLKELAAVLGKETIDTYNTGESRGAEVSHSLNYQKLGKELMSRTSLL